MRKLTLTLAAAACVGLAAPAFATERISAGQGGPQVVRADTLKVDEFSAQKKKAAKKKGKTARKSWGG